MCLGIPGKVIKTGEGLMPMGLIDVVGDERPCCFAYTPEVEVGDFVMFQHGFAVDTVEQAEAEETLRTMHEFDMLGG